jgi:DNA-binding transcriptional ArsR family regulator
MVNSRSRRLDETFFALSDPTRRAIVSRLAKGEATVAELSRPFRVSAPAISKHLRVLERAGLVRQQRQGRSRRCRLVPAPLKEAADFVERYRRFWEGQLDRLAEYLEQNQQKEPS